MLKDLRPFQKTSLSLLSPDELVIQIEANRLLLFQIKLIAFFQWIEWGEILGKGTAVDNLKWRISPTNQEPFNLKFEVRIVSAGPDVVDSETETRFRDKDEYQLKYLQDGRYEVLKNTE